MRRTRCSTEQELEQRRLSSWSESSYPATTKTGALFLPQREWQRRITQSLKLIGAELYAASARRLLPLPVRLDIDYQGKAFFAQPPRQHTLGSPVAITPDSHALATGAGVIIFSRIIARNITRRCLQYRQRYRSSSSTAITCAGAHLGRKLAPPRKRHAAATSRTVARKPEEKAQSSGNSTANATTSVA